MNTGGPAFPGTLLDWMAGQALAGLCSSWYDRHKDDPETQRGYGPMRISQSAYTHAESMLDEKARREAVVNGSKTTDHSGDTNKMVKQLDACALLRKFIDAVPDGFETCLLWDLRKEAIHLLDVVPDHFPDATKMVEINRELVEALEVLVCGAEKVRKRGYVFAELGRGVVMAGDALAKAKETKP